MTITIAIGDKSKVELASIEDFRTVLAQSEEFYRLISDTVDSYEDTKDSMAESIHLSIEDKVEEKNVRYKVVITESTNFLEKGAIGRVVADDTSLDGTIKVGLLDWSQERWIDKRKTERIEDSPIRVGDWIVGIKSIQGGLPVGSKARITYQFTSDSSIFLCEEINGSSYAVVSDTVVKINKSKDNDKTPTTFKGEIIEFRNKELPYGNDFTVGRYYKSESDNDTNGGILVRDNNGTLRKIPQSNFGTAWNTFEVGDIVRNYSDKIGGIAYNKCGVVTNVCYEDMTAEVAGFNNEGEFLDTWIHAIKDLRKIETGE